MGRHTPCAWDPFDSLDDEFFELLSKEGSGWASAADEYVRRLLTLSPTCDLLNVDRRSIGWPFEQREGVPPQIAKRSPAPLRGQDGSKPILGPPEARPSVGFVALNLPCAFGAPRADATVARVARHRRNAI